MGITLTSRTISSTYKGLLKLSDNNSLNTVYKTVTDGFGNDSALKISSVAVSAVKLYSEMDSVDIAGDADGSVVVTRDYLSENTTFLTGNGTTSYLPKYGTLSTLTDSIMYEDAGVRINVEGKFNVDTTSTSTSLSEDTTSLVTIDRAHTAAASGSVYGSKTTLNGNSSFLDGGVVASVSENFQNGSGGAFYSYGSMVKSRQYGSGNIGFLSGQVIKVDAQADATSEIDYIRGLGLNCMVDSAFTTVNNIQGTRQKINLYEGTVGDVTVCLLDIDRTNATITGDIAYLHMQADTGLHTTTGGTARSIYSQNTLPSEFNGSISTPLLLVGEVQATDSIHTEFTNTDADTTRAIRSQVTKNATADGGSAFGGSFKSLNTSTGSIVDLQGVVAVAEHTGSGDVSFIVGTRGVATHEGTGDMIGGVYASFNDARSRGTGICALSYVLGGNNTAELDNPNATVANLVGSISEVTLIKGTVGDLTPCYVDFDYTEQGLATVTGDFAMIKIESHVTPPVSGTARAINSESTLPSAFAGRVGIGLSVEPASALQVQGTMSLDNTGQSVYVGNQAGYNETPFKSRNVGIGFSALEDNDTGSDNTAVGMSSLKHNTTGGQNTAIGKESLSESVSEANNTAVGYQSMKETIASANTALGHSTLLANTTGPNNTAIGERSMLSNIGGETNTAVGMSSLGNNTSGSNNVAIGAEAGSFTAASLPSESGEHCVYIGSQTTSAASSTTNEIVIGQNAEGLGSDSVVIGNGSIEKTILKGNVGLGVDAPTAKLDIETENTLTSGYSYGSRSKITNKNTSGSTNAIGVRAEGGTDATGDSGNIYGVFSKALSYGSGDASFLIANYGTAENSGTGDVSAMYGAWTQARSRGTSAVNITVLYGSVNKAMTENANSTIGEMVGSWSVADLTAGTITGDVSVIEARLNGTGATIGGDLSMLRIGNSPTPTTVTGTARAIWSQSTLPSELAGDLKVSGALNVGTVGVHADNAAAITAGLVVGDVYRTGDNLKVVH